MRPLLLLPLALASIVHAQQPLERLFYYVDREDSYESFVRHADRIDVLGVGGYRVDSLGILWGSVDRRVLDLARQRNVKIMPLLVNENFHQPSLRRLLSDTAARHRATRAMADECRLHRYWGWQFDIENIHIDDRDRLTTWYGEAARALRAAGCTISIAVVHRPSELAGPLGYHRFLFDSWRAAYDLAALARLGDFVTIMTYSQHTRRTTPGPQAGIPWIRSVLEYVLRSVPANKLSLGVPSQGLHYFTREDNTIPERARSWAETVSWTWGSGLAERYSARLTWDEEQAVTWGRFENGGTFEWLFLEDERSFRAKLAVAREKKLRGISVWVLGPEDERIWEALRR